MPWRSASSRSSPPPSAVPNGTARFEANAQLVIETVSVRDKSGAPVKGLTAKDFSITEDGVAQTISFCEFQTVDETPEPELNPAPAAATQPAPVAKVVPVVQTDIAPERPGDLHYRNRRLMVLYFDMTAMPVPDQLRALDSAQKFITKQMNSADLMAIIKYDGEAVRVLQDFTDEPRRPA